MGLGPSSPQALLSSKPDAGALFIHLGPAENLRSQLLSVHFFGAMAAAVIYLAASRDGAEFGKRLHMCGCMDVWMYGCMHVHSYACC
jgi:hypothetical protein